MEEFINVGKRIPKLDAEEKVTGKAIYIHDLKAAGRSVPLRAGEPRLQPERARAHRPGRLRST